MLREIAIGVTGLITALAGAVVMSSGTGCTATPVDISQVAITETTIAGYTGDQLANAAIIMNTATAAGLPQQAQIVGVMTAIAETGLRNLTTVESSTALGVFGQEEWWGTAAERLDPTRAASLFYAQLARIPDWQNLKPSAAASQAQGKPDSDLYTPSLKAATEIVSTLTPISQGEGCDVSGDSQALALELVNHLDDGTLIGLEQPPINQIRWIAEGATVPDCGIDVRTLQIIVLSVRNFDRVGISSINRLCTGDLIGGGTLPHVREGGGKSVDFYMLDNRNLTGADGLSLRLISLLDPIVPGGSRIGQFNCRAEAGVQLSLQNFGEVADTCHHLHIDVANTDEPLTFD